MHEWALAESIILTVVDKAVNEGKRVIEEIDIVIGELQAIDLEIFKYALNELKNMVKEEKGIEIRDYRITIEEAKFRCNRCGYVWRLKEAKLDEEAKESIHFIPEAVHAYMQCPRCGSRDFEIISGRGVYIRLD